MSNRIAGIISLLASIITILAISGKVTTFFRKAYKKFSKFIKNKRKELKQFTTPKDNYFKFDPFYFEIPEGIIPRKKLKKCRKLENEVFAIELLTRDIELEKTGGKINVSIDRRNVQYALITNKGKANLNKEIIEKPDRTKELMNEDKDIQLFLNSIDKSIMRKIELARDKKLLRWASGGIISIVEYEGDYWIPMFYRDKEPYGWNIQLGSSERYFDKDNRVNHNVDTELNNPSKFIYREFDEELLIFKEPPNSSKEENIVIPFALPYSNENTAIDFNEKHIELRKKYDGLNIVVDTSYVYCKQVDTKMSLQITTPDGKKLKRLSNVLVCFNLLELGIEVVQVIKYKIDRNNVLLDGEILTYYDKFKYKDELVRMPMALISCRFLEKHFKGDISELDYTSGVNPSIKINENITNNKADNIIIFDYDLKQRLRVIRQEKDTIGKYELDRYKQSFSSFFEEIKTKEDDIKATVKNDFTRYFTPATAKILNLFFNQVDPKEYTINNDQLKKV